MFTEELKYYLKKIYNLRRDRKYGGAPHKPILLLAVISSIEDGLIVENKIRISPELIGKFKSIWFNLVKSEKHHCLFSLPFFYLKSDEFWHLIPNLGFEKLLTSNIKIKGISSLKEIVSYAKLDDLFFKILISKENRNLVKEAILTHYFPEKASKKIIANQYVSSIDLEILNENSETYRDKLIKLQRLLNKEEFEEEKFLRNHLFKRQVVLNYQDTCAISKLKIASISEISLIDACHIIPFSISYDDTISNGFPLSPTLHRAFDRGLISIDENYKVIVSKSFIEQEKSVYSIKQFEGKKILLPNNKNLYPNIEHFVWHQNNVFIR